ncbi:acylphosphatase [Sphingomonas xanthus]|uniref:Acylphosphatase n=1 Tax=Sphingomonas xanthus TaxID=2594473 RepID=A0A516ISG7_9SPHN|nr:acylphosphatase [Sphingomonas xanthus]QDP19836.1 acylphosphatase [Sphingomonas xanthus]
MVRVRRIVRISGRVQGVFFRAWVREQAEGLGLAGWVRNCADGTVEAELEGEEDVVSQMIDRMQSGPPLARVDDLEVEASEPLLARSFTVRH